MSESQNHRPELALPSLMSESQNHRPEFNCVTFLLPEVRNVVSLRNSVLRPMISPPLICNLSMLKYGKSHTSRLLQDG
ncbi:hypothetical protein K1719_000183 [Acacia pycnantha]|nr:hypothetical protein K1719_000183 [Acacia pycnantha]